jgi:hypothetical protein
VRCIQSAGVRVTPVAEDRATAVQIAGHGSMFWIALLRKVEQAVNW